MRWIICTYFKTCFRCLLFFTSFDLLQMCLSLYAARARWWESAIMTCFCTVGEKDTMFLWQKSKVRAKTDTNSLTFVTDVSNWNWKYSKFKDSSENKFVETMKKAHTQKHRHTPRHTLWQRIFFFTKTIYRCSLSVCSMNTCWNTKDSHLNATITHST